MTTNQKDSAILRFLPKYVYALLSSLFLFTVGVFSRRHRFLIFQIACHFGWQLQTDEERLPVLRLSKVLDRFLNLSLLEPIAAGGNVSLLELLVIASLARRAPRPYAFEIGTFDGRTALNLAANLPHEGKVFTLDLPKSELRHTKFDLAPGESAFVDKEASGVRFADTEFASKITQLHGDSASFDFTPYRGQMGFIFVDGSHAGDYVRQDSATALDLAANGAIILWHDYQRDWQGVVRTLNDLSESNPVFRRMYRIEGTSLVILKYEDPRRSS